MEERLILASLIRHLDDLKSQETDPRIAKEYDDAIWNLVKIYNEKKETSS